VKDGRGPVYGQSAGHGDEGVVSGSWDDDPKAVGDSVDQGREEVPWICLVRFLFVNSGFNYY
jgi:hypothetical protein